jgi:AraC-like DNA-binding protein
MLEGELIFHEDGKRISLKKNQWYIQRSGLYQEGREVSRSPSYYFIHFHGEFTVGDVAVLPMEGVTNVEQLRPLLQELFNIERSYSRTNIACNALFFSILAHLYSVQHIGSHSQRVLRKIEQFFLRNYMLPRALEKTAKEFHLTKAYITRLFRKHLQTTPYRYLTKLRIDHACHMMLDTNRTINDIAFEVGYTDVSAFYRAFIKQYKSSPSEWRKQQT